MSPTETNALIDIHRIQPEAHEEVEIKQFIRELDVDFPSAEVMSAAAREINNKVYIIRRK